MAIYPSQVPPPSQDTPPTDSLDGSADWRIFVAFTLPHYGTEDSARKSVANLLSDIKTITHEPGVHLEDWWLIPVLNHDHPFPEQENCDPAEG